MTQSEEYIKFRQELLRFKKLTTVEQKRAIVKWALYVKEGKMHFLTNWQKMILRMAIDSKFVA